MLKLRESAVFQELNIGFALDEGLASPDNEFIGNPLLTDFIDSHCAVHDEQTSLPTTNPIPLPPFSLGKKCTILLLLFWLLFSFLR